ncbi:Tetratricopeptide repeat-containing protein [Catalinimonas alkaloidigena]|uniref:Tetratricopeptide repeat-containing protein n=1 Tax=Catalinimonas alkaloidigena TaxID=1075417 RepID=A0A1G9GXD5_9BACT|nr:OmpA family protein [Catalinimonas alkaloidigena]SDL05326.1 Tetratricopeptide repeat-containing protein [Catalinimonas alkaloidigena]
MRKFCFILLFFSSVSIAWAQPGMSSDKKAVKLYDEAGLLIKQRQFEEAIAKLSDALRRDPSFAEAHLQLGNVYSLYREQDKAHEHFEQFYKLRPNTPRAQELAFTLGEHTIRAGNYPEARTYYQEFLKNPKGSRERREWAQHQLAICDFAEEAMKHPVDIQATPMKGNVNVFPQQYFPVLTADQNILVYTARLGHGNEFDENILASRRLPDGGWTQPGSISPNINTPRNEGTCTISADARVMVFTMCSDKIGEGSCDLYITYRQGNQWQRPQNMGPVINSPHWDTQPSLSADGRTLYFASNRPGGRGKTDIWMAHQNDKGEWQQPTNLGAPINTPGEDLAPFIHNNDKTLYFASDGHLGMGGRDLFFSELSGKTWNTPKNLGYPLNTYLDESSLFVTADGQTAYYSKDDYTDPKKPLSEIYSFPMPPALQPSQKTGFVAGKVFDEETKKPLTATIELIDLNSGETVQKVTSDAQNGEYLIVLTQGSEYALYVNSPSYLFKSLAFDYKEKKQRTEGLTLDVPMSAVRAGSKTTLNNIFFASGEYKLLDESRVELNKLIGFLETNPDIKVEIEGHTDDVGTDAANLQLSKQRAQSVYTYLTEKGIASARLQYHGYGEAQPKVPNDSEEGRRQNRRIEFRIL